MRRIPPSVKGGSRSKIGLRRLNGQDFFLSSDHKTKNNARKEAEYLKTSAGGYVNARVVKTNQGWSVYTAFSKKFYEQNRR